MEKMTCRLIATGLSVAADRLDGLRGSNLDAAQAEELNAVRDFLTELCCALDEYAAGLGSHALRDKRETGR